MNRKLKIKKKETENIQKEAPSPKKRMMLKQKYRHPQIWLEEEEMPEDLEAFLFPDPEDDEE